ncbi:hypothetical protein KXX13_007338 [Aspergillus fumigatus]|nr:hypothetical protein KXX13_007338 [Aspergillus fumigatus]KAH1912384.1 hypothetical protein KXW69_008290 [Aspergillus fumigatus]
MDSVTLRRKDTTKGPPLRVLSLDGGGVRGYSMLIILQELMYRIYVETEGKPPRRDQIPKPCDHFDLIVGTGTGGLIALMLGRLRLDLETCKEVYVRMTRRVFETDKTIAGIPYRSTLFKASKLEEAIRECVREHTVFEAEGNDMPNASSRNSIASAPYSPAAIPQRSVSRGSFSTSGASHPSTPISQRHSAIINGLRWGNPDALLYDNRENRTKTAVTALYKGTPRNGSAVLLRSYDSRKEPPPEFNCTIWQAGRATSATGLAFKPIQIGQHVFIDEGAGTYNPAPQVLDEAAVNEWPGREIGVFISVGTGKRPPGTNSRQHEWWEDFFGDALGTFGEARRRLIAKIEGCEEIHQEMLRTHLAKRGVNKDNYYRLNVEVGVGEFGMNEWNRLADISTNTRRYLSKSEVKKSIMDAGVKFAKIERMHRRLAAHAAAGYDPSTEPTEDPPFSPHSYTSQGSVFYVPPPSNPMAVELPAELPGDFAPIMTHQPPSSGLRVPSPPAEDALPLHPTPQDGVYPSPGRVSSSSFSYTHSDGSRPGSQQQMASPRLSVEQVQVQAPESNIPPPVPPKTPIPYPDNANEALMPMPLMVHHGRNGSTGKVRPPYPVDEPPPAVNKQRKPSYHTRQVSWIGTPVIETRLAVCYALNDPMEISHSLVAHATTLAVRSGASSSTSERPPAYKAVGIALAVSSGVFIGTSFVLKKTGLLKANVKYNEEAGEGYGYLKNVWWWSGMILMIVGEICNFVAYAFVDAILVTPLGALSVVITTILSAIFLKERLSFVGKVGCFSCIIGSVVIALNAPEQSSVGDIQDMKHYVIAPGFLAYAGVIIVGCAIVALWLGPRYGKKSMFVYISICSLIGGLSVVATQGLGAAILAQINGKSQFKEWFLYVLLVFVIATLLTEIIYLNKALNLFNAALVTPTYYVFFTSSTIVSSAVLFRGFKGTGMQIATVILGFLQICAGVVLLQLSKSAKDVPDAAIFKGDLDQIREVAAQEEPETEPKADSIRGAAAIIRRISTARRRMEEEEVRRYIRDRQEDYLKPPAENEIIEWDGLRRRKTVLGQGPTMARPRTPGQSHTPLAGSESPGQVDHPDRRPSTRQSDRSFLDDLRSRASSIMHPGQWHQVYNPPDGPADPVHLAVSPVHGNTNPDTSYHGAGMREVSGQTDTSRSVAWADETQDHDASPHTAKRQFSFNTVFNRIRSKSESEPPKPPPHSPRSILRRSHLVPGAERHALKGATEEERLGLVKGDSRVAGEDWDMHEKLERVDSSGESISDAPEPYGSVGYGGHGAYDYGYAAQTSPTEMQSGWQLPSSRSVTAAADPGAVQSSSRPRPNPLPPLPDEEPFIAGEASHMRVELQSPTSPRGTDGRGWRRPLSEHGDSPSSTNRRAFI